jgi:hypothetical protein
MGNDHEVEFHEIKINFFMRSFHEVKFFPTFHEIKIPNN